MSAYFSPKYASLVPYTPGEQPQERKFVKLNTNESPFPPSPKAVRAASQELLRMELYSDPECRALNAKIAEVYGIAPDEVMMTNGSDEILNFAFMAFCDNRSPALFPDITYGFYPVFARLNGVPYTELPLREDFTIDTAPYMRSGATIFLANPNAPTGIALSRDEVERHEAQEGGEFHRVHTVIPVRLQVKLPYELRGPLASLVLLTPVAEAARHVHQVFKQNLPG